MVMLTIATKLLSQTWLIGTCCRCLQDNNVIIKTLPALYFSYTVFDVCFYVWTFCGCWLRLSMMEIMEHMGPNRCLVEVRYGLETGTSPIFKGKYRQNSPSMNHFPKRICEITGGSMCVFACFCPSKQPSSSCANIEEPSPLTNNGNPYHRCICIYIYICMYVYIYMYIYMCCMILYDIILYHIILCYILYYIILNYIIL